jgi:hypothetical protein
MARGGWDRPPEEDYILLLGERPITPMNVSALRRRSRR